MIYSYNSIKYINLDMNHFKLFHYSIRLEGWKRAMLRPAGAIIYRFHVRYDDHQMASKSR